ncbi:MAG: phosphatase PAP2 family protein [Oscillospiraceae bacterium]|nr:phosphatase PAP2 family protein [Oscillospiraceae bacterium]
MEFLRLLEGIRTPFLDTIFSTVTQLGEETVIILAGLLFFWCINKKEGYYLLSVGLVGTVLNQFLKMIFRIPRPWVKDGNFTIVESAKEAATGYSFPSGHTQAGVGLFGGIARFNKNTILRIVCVVVCILIGFSRMYLGVHTPADVLVSALLAVVLIFGFYPIFDKAYENKKSMRIFFASITAFAVAFLVFMSVYKFPNDTDAHNLESAGKNAYKMLGCILGIWLTYEIDVNYSHFDTEAIWWVQILKLVIGILPILAIKSGLKEPLYLLIGENYIADGVRYFLLTAFAGCVWPLTFPLFNRLAKGKK